MYLTQLSLLNLDLKTLNNLDEYFSSLSLNARENLTFTNLQTHLKIDETSALELKTKLEENEYIIDYYVIYCPECGLLIKKFSDIDEIKDYEHCHNCGAQIVKDPEYIDIRFKLNDRIFKFNYNNNNTLTSDAVREYSLKKANRNNFLYHLTKREKEELLSDLKKAINKNLYMTTKQQGDALEHFTLKLFKKIKCLECFPYNTSTNQIDNLLKNKLHTIIFEGLSKYIVVECKNEQKSPDVSYIDKLGGIINTFNNKKLLNTGIVVSKTRPTKKFFDTSYIYINSQNQLAIISITVEEIENLLKSNENLIDFIERKILNLYARKPK